MVNNGVNLPKMCPKEKKKLKFTPQWVKFNPRKKIKMQKNGVKV